jgi:hypothetical protein
MQRIRKEILNFLGSIILRLHTVAQHFFVHMVLGWKEILWPQLFLWSWYFRQVLLIARASKV